MDTFKVTIQPTTKLDTLHDSQRLFGFLAYRMLDMHGEPVLERMLDAVKKGDQSLAISSIVPEGATFWPSYTIAYSTPEHFDSIIAKKLKKVRYVSFSVLEAIHGEKYKGDHLVKNLKGGTYEIQKDLLMKKDELAYEYALGIDIRFSSKEKTPYNLKSYGVNRNSLFTFYVTTDNPEMIELVKSLETLNLGKYKHASLNQYKVRSVEPVELKGNGDTHILMSKWVPGEKDTFDRERSRVHIDMARSRLDNRMMAIYDSKHEDYFSVVKEGSLIQSEKMPKGKLKTRTRASKVMGKPIYYNGLAFFYPVGDDHA